ncbi:SGT1-domain-containing protein [Mytilinidion resinicola]|uniref:SGT1-domain-containing protein n=1 Tax=Mytilinidion resinicola TaxID=574789 RepID=A0A6A6Z0I9_9PEZI|nr:SGT1-domain-containing protein [Mytilinidion resinicola]KAF2814682.1 SGT1-domain-containing protein [Mytilinidion resinicola]
MAHSKVPKDDFKWFGEGFDGFPKHLPEDCVEYMIILIHATLSDIQKRSWLLRGRTNYGDSVADEWLIVYLLRELSKQFSDAWIRVYDTDGEFLLIQAANALPRWLNPEVAENRVWINNSKLLIIPLSSPSNTTSLTLKESLQTISSAPTVLQNLIKTESEAFDRLSSYPSAISDNQHHATIPIPRKVAAILHASPSHIAPAVEAFYLRDPISLRSLQRKETTELIFPPEDFVQVSTRFTRTLFAQLRSQEWVPPGLWGGALASFVSKTPNSRDLEKAEIGLKLAAGFEMLVQDKQNKDKKAVREIKLLVEDIESGEEQLPSDCEIKEWGVREDDEKWLDINFEDFEKELAGKGAKTAGQPAGMEAKDAADTGFGDKTAQENLRKMVERFESFLDDDEAGVEGAEGLDDMDFDNDDESDEDESNGSDEDKEVEFNEAEFARLMREMMGMPSTTDKATLVEEARALARVQEVDSADGDEEDVIEGDEIRDVMERMEAELKEAGALRLDPPPRETTTKSGSGSKKGKEKAIPSEEDANDLSEDEVDIDYNLAKNLLESLKGQGGMSGPVGNMLGLMRVQMPRDEGDEEERAR